jgi:predicted DNA-binding transcriptional regulator YafY
VWTLGAWCETRNDFRNFRLDRMVGITMTDRRFVEERGKSLNEFLRKMRETM